MASKNSTDKTLERMRFLMEYGPKAPISNRSAAIEYSVDASDGKTYGIIREGTTYYIKTTTPDKKDLKESYDYIGGYNYRNEHGYKSYNEATKQLELKLMQINESYGKHEDVSIADPNKSAKAIKVLTVEARNEINRINQILENSNNISKYNVIGPDNTANPEGKGEASDPKKQGDPFEDEVKPEMNKETSTTTLDSVNKENKEVKGVEKELTSDKNQKGGDSDKSKTVKSDLKGSGVADQAPNGGKAVKMNESEEDIAFDEEDFNEEDFNTTDDAFAQDLEDGAFGGNDELAGTGDVTDNTEISGEVVADDNDVDTEIDDMIDEAFGNTEETETETSTEEIVDESCKEEVKEGCKEEKKKIKETCKECGKNKPFCEKPKKKAIGLNEAKINKLTDLVFERLVKKSTKKVNEAKTEALTDKVLKEVKRRLKEEQTNLNVWGDHPSYRKQAFTTPEDTEVAKNANSWDDASVKGKKPYGASKGDPKPFIKSKEDKEKLIDVITDKVMCVIKESLKKK